MITEKHNFGCFKCHRSGRWDKPPVCPTCQKPMQRLARIPRGAKQWAALERVITERRLAVVDFHNDMVVAFSRHPSVKRIDERLSYKVRYCCF